MEIGGALAVILRCSLTDSYPRRYDREDASGAGVMIQAATRAAAGKMGAARSSAAGAGSGATLR